MPLSCFHSQPRSTEEWISALPGELDVDAVALWQIVSFGREGAKPVVGAMDGIHVWTAMDYGSDAESMSEASDAIRGRDPDGGDVWFVLPHLFNAGRPPDESLKWKDDLCWQGARMSSAICGDEPESRMSLPSSGLRSLVHGRSA